MVQFCICFYYGDLFILVMYFPHENWKRESDMSPAPGLKQAPSFTKEDNGTIQSGSTLLA